MVLPAFSARCASRTAAATAAIEGWPAGSCGLDTFREPPGPEALKNGRGSIRVALSLAFKRDLRRHVEVSGDDDGALVRRREHASQVRDHPVKARTGVDPAVRNLLPLAIQADRGEVGPAFFVDHVRHRAGARVAVRELAPGHRREIAVGEGDTRPRSKYKVRPERDNGRPPRVAGILSIDRPIHGPECGRR